MIAIQNHNYKQFEKHINSSKNTICGRHPLYIFLKIIEKSSLKAQLKTKFVKYAQSEQVKDPSKSSVSYASSITFIEWLISNDINLYIFKIFYKNYQIFVNAG